MAEKKFNLFEDEFKEEDFVKVSEPHISEIRHSQHEFDEDYPMNGPCC